MKTSSMCLEELRIVSTRKNDHHPLPALELPARDRFLLYFRLSTLIIFSCSRVDLRALVHRVKGFSQPGYAENVRELARMRLSAGGYRLYTASLNDPHGEIPLGFLIVDPPPFWGFPRGGIIPSRSVRVASLRGEIWRL